MSKRKTHLYNLYSSPLPIKISKSLSLRDIIFGFDIVQDEIVVLYKDECFQALDRSSAMKLWYNGFFGKGSLSRSEPTFTQRTKRRLAISTTDIDGNGNGKGKESSSFTSEEITNLRRLERLDFKAKRAHLEELENFYKVANDQLKLKEVEAQKQELTNAAKLKTPLNVLQAKFGGTVTTNLDEMRQEDLKLLPSQEQDITLLDTLEYLQLSIHEVIFLSLINRIKLYRANDDSQISFKELMTEFCKPVDLYNYIVYHHYRTLGWCCKPGTKFSTDFVLYKKGPVFQHAEYAVLVMSPKVSRNLNWTKIHAINRVVGGVKKQLVLSYVHTTATNSSSMIDEYDDYVYDNDNDDSNDYEEDDEFEEIVEFLDDFKEDDEIKSRELLSDFLKLHEISEIGLNRWSSTRNRE